MYMDLSGLEQLKATLFSASAKSGEGAYILGRLLTELREDAVFGLFPPAEAVPEDLNTAFRSLLVMKETLYDLAKATGYALEGCAEAEQMKIDRIREADKQTKENEA